MVYLWLSKNQFTEGVSIVIYRQEILKDIRSFLPYKLVASFTIQFFLNLDLSFV